jgi:hypothetical protein
LCAEEVRDVHPLRADEELPVMNGKFNCTVPGADSADVPSAVEAQVSGAVQ